jgi:hypothetical protein
VYSQLYSSSLSLRLPPELRFTEFSLHHDKLGKHLHSTLPEKLKQNKSKQKKLKHAKLRQSKKIVQKLKINIDQINHFILKKFPLRFCGTDSDGVVLFLEKDKLKPMYEKMRALVEQVAGMQFFGFRFVEDGLKVVVNVHDLNFSYDRQSILRELIEGASYSIFRNNVLIVLADLALAGQSSTMTREEFVKIAMNVTRSGVRHVLNPMTKPMRAKVNA